MYTQDYDERFPRNYVIYTTGHPEYASTPPGGLWYDGSWGGRILFTAQFLYPYTKSVQLWSCPSGLKGAHVDPDATGDFQKAPFIGHYGGSYSLMRGCYDGDGGGCAGNPTSKLSQVQTASTIHMMGDSGNAEFDATFLANPGGYGYYIPGIEEAAGGPRPGYDCSALATAYVAPGSDPNTILNDCRRGRHFGGSNIVFADGHVKWLSAKTILQNGAAPFGLGQ